MDSNTSFDVILLDVDPSPPGDVKLKGFNFQGTKISGDQPRVLMDEDVEKNRLTVQCEMEKVVHGTMTPYGSPATLVVLQFHFMPRDNNRRFKEVEITLTFSAGELIAIAPDGRFAMMESRTEQVLSHTFSPSIQGGLGLGNATMGYTWQRTETKTIKGCVTIEGATKALGNCGKRRKNSAFWGLYEDKETESGIPSFMRTALLLEREMPAQDAPSERFGATINITGKVNRAVSFKEGCRGIEKKMSSQRDKEVEIFFDPESSRGEVKDVNNLKSEVLDTYKRLSMQPRWTDGDEKQQEQVATPIKALEEEAPRPLPQPLTEDSAVDVSTFNSATTSPMLPESVSPDCESCEGSLMDVKTESSASEEEEEETTKPALGIANPDRLAERKSAFDGLRRLVLRLIGVEGADEDLVELRERLSMVTTEAELVNRLIFLVQEEKSLLQKIRRLERQAEGEAE